MKTRKWIINSALIVLLTVASLGCQDDLLQGADSVFISGASTFPDGTPVRNRPFLTTMTVAGEGFPVCEYRDNEPSALSEQSVSGTKNFWLSADSNGYFEDLTLMRGFDWHLGSQNQCPPKDSSRTYTNVGLSAVKTIRLEAFLEATEEVCADYCNSYTREYCDTYCQASGDTSTCHTTCQSTTLTSCGERCHNATKIIATATAYGNEVTPPADPMAPASMPSPIADEYQFKLVFTDLQ